ncbi:MAG: ATP-grasp domain-containing protein [Alphaproteobacteria bacterium]|nr:MAG: ATP-grasp domain-containing protein [Alphaproteobacteria bacterium]
MPDLNTILIANRGEIACRIIRTARAMGYRSVAVYSEADADAAHVHAADMAVPIGPAPAAESYLCPERLIAAARRTGADAIHPGYGFLSENAGFARACAEAGLTFIGPPAEAIALMGSKQRARQAVEAAGVPCIPGYHGADQGDARLAAEAARIGYPVMVKASAGGGGRGLRRVGDPAALPDALRAARSEALSAFGSGDLILERALDAPRHVEIQIFADDHGNILHLGERDCSLQRRHQKVIEEAPSPAVTPALRAGMGAAAVRVARACGYRGAGTVEFLLDADGRFHFLEMNTRLQVEHPVTELVTGLDLVEWQLIVASGEPLPLGQDDIALDGWAMEARLYAEDTRAGFLPQTGRVLVWEPATGPGLRVDHGLRVGQTVSRHYDPLLAKIVAHGRNREEARRRLARAVEDSLLLGVRTNRAFLSAILRHDAFAGGAADTGFVERHLAGHETLTPAPPPLRILALAAILMHAATGLDGAAASGWPGWRNSAATPRRCRLACAGEHHELSLAVDARAAPMRFTARAGAEEEVIEILGMEAGRCSYIADGLRRSTRFVRDGGTLHLDDPSGAMAFEDATHQPAIHAEEAGSGRIAAPMDGAVVAVRAAAGERVARGQILVVLEAMKMEHPLRADIDGVVEEIRTAPGDQVRIRQLLVTIAAEAG